MKSINIAAKTVFLLALPLMILTGCFSGGEDYDEVQAQRDEYRARLQEIYQANDQLNQEISAMYANCEILSTQLAMKMAMLVHREYVVNLVRPRVEAAPPPRTPSRNTTATTPRQTPRSEGQNRPPRTSGGTGSGTSGGTATSGGANDTTTVAPPPANPKPRGSIDWGN